MMYDTLLSRSFSKHEKQKLRYWGLITCLLIALSFCTVFKPYLGPLPVLNLRLSIGAGQKLEIVNDTSSSLKLISGDDAVLKKNSALMANDTSSSQQVVKEIARKNDEPINNTSSSQEIIKEIIMNNTVKLNNTSSKQTIAGDIITKNKTEPVSVCNMLERSDFCEIKGDIRIDANSSIVYIVSSEIDILAASANTSWTIKPYARKGDRAAMSMVREWTLKMVKDHQNTLKCTQIHNVPAILFSLGGYSGNHFHAFTDIILPLYSTAQPFNGDVQLLVTDRKPWWVAKFNVLLNALSRYEIIEIGKRGESTHCFSSITVGLKRQSSKELNLDSMGDFRQFLRSSYSLRKTTAIKINNGGLKKRPRLVIISRQRSRKFSNIGEIAQLAKRLGYKVVVFEPDANVSRSAQVMNSCDVVMGVHGAGLTNMVFLPLNAILIQVIPFGGAEWVSKTYFQEPAKDMNIRYLEYKISLKESSLIEQYPADHVVLRNPYAIQKQGWEAFRSIYFDKQNVKLDLDGFRHTLLKALELLHQ
ncbi:hypothetical protein P3X46_000676 [Hevea brasiliensis]|uniref:Glycosyltransferase 61 catalytic domain-containing protein n=1 Tax=Hevea brasiliensis TaxID=3981 RepID=A0ABQ9NAT7_HEVBR|nr:alpha-1,3-arabinosyltransferase XAT3 [Hevea brasiliensis]KAJ9189371.1 hypothetical protein P3X46_000676 [Hevea brasiliensis]